MGKVFAREMAFIGHESGREYKVHQNELFDDDHELVLGNPGLFSPVAESTDAQVKSLRAELEELKALIAGQAQAPVDPPATAPKKAAKGELKAEVA